MHRNIAFPILVFSLTLGVAGAQTVEDQHAKSPTAQDPLGTFQVAPEFQWELVVQEPLVVSPCALAFDEQGRMFVVENRGYPVGPAKGEPPIGRIAMLEDADGDGRYDKRTEFATELTFPNGILPWRGGWIVTCAPDVLYLKDTNGDGRADERRVLLTGFSTTGSTQLRASHPTLGADNWVYLSAGLSGGTIVSPLKPQQPPVEFKRSDIRFHPDTGEVQLIDGASQFGMSFDNFGHRFICYNRVQVQHVASGSHWWRRNPHLAFSDTVENCPVDMIAPQPDGKNSAARIFPISSNITTADSHAGTFSAACAVTVYRGTAFAEKYRSAVFSCDPTANLIHVDRLVPHGPTFSAQRIHPDREVVASKDDWFRPVFLATAPDGALYVCDMYRKSIEHPDYLPVEIRKHTDFESGKNMGRIYRLRAGGNQLPQPATVFHDAPLSKLRDALAADDPWHRDTAHRLLLERRDAKAIPDLEQLLKAESSRPADAAAYVHALGLLAELRGVTDAELTAALQHPLPGVREYAISLAIPQFDRLPETAARVIKLAEDDDARVRFVTALALGEIKTNDAVSALARIALRDADDRWSRAAVLSSVFEREGPFLVALIAGAQTTPGTPDLYYELGRLLGAGQPDSAWTDIFTHITDWPKVQVLQQVPLLVGIADGLRSRHKPGTMGIFGTVLAKDDAKKSAIIDTLQDVMRRANEVAADVSQPVEIRRWATALAAHCPFEEVGETLLGLVETHQPDVLQLTAIRALAKMSSPKVAATLLERNRFGRYSPSVRQEVLSSLAASAQQLSGVLDALEAGNIDTVDFDPALRQQILNRPDESIRNRANKLWETLGSSDRDQVYEEYKSCLELPPNSENGRAVFKRVCAQCHRLDREGFAVGPDLFGIRNQPKESILLHIVVPDREITNGFRAYSVQTTDGRVLTGLISSETPTSITLRQPLGKEETLLRQDIDDLIASKASLMPPGFEKTTSRQEFADLIAYLKGEQTR